MISKIKYLSSLVVLSAITLTIPGILKAEEKTKKIGAKKASSFPNTVKNPLPGEIIVKCAGIVKKGKNHCEANGHACNGHSADDPKIKDFDPNEWIYVRKEVCDATPGRIVGKKKVVEG